MFSGYGCSDRGRGGPTNEDCFAIDEGLRLSVVADGLGGHKAGEIASRLAVDTIIDYVRRCHSRPARHESRERWPYGFDPALSIAGNRLRTAVHLANAQVLETSFSDERYQGMATTVVVALVIGGRLSVGHVGDSRLYVASRGRMRQLTVDDSWMAALAGPASAGGQDNGDHPMSGVLTGVVGRRGTGVHIAEEELSGNELLLLTTDGVHGVLDARDMERLAAGPGDPRAIAERLVGTAIDRGSPDNCTAVVLHCSGVG